MLTCLLQVGDLEQFSPCRVVRGGGLFRRVVEAEVDLPAGLANLRLPSTPVLYHTHVAGAIRPRRAGAVLGILCRGGEAEVAGVDAEPVVAQVVQLHPLPDPAIDPFPREAMGKHGPAVEPEPPVPVRPLRGRPLPAEVSLPDFRPEPLLDGPAGPGCPARCGRARLALLACGGGTPRRARSIPDRHGTSQSSYFQPRG